MKDDITSRLNFHEALRPTGEPNAPHTPAVVLRQRDDLLAACKLQTELIETVCENLGLAGLIDAAKGTGLSQLGYATAMLQVKALIANVEKP